MELWGREITLELAISGAAILIAFWSAWTAHRARRDTRQGLPPVVSIEVQTMERQPGWRRIVVTVVNRYPYPLKADALRVLWPQTARLLSFRDAVESDVKGVVEVSPLPGAALARRVPVGLYVPGARSDGSSAAHWQTLFLSLADDGRRSVYFRLSLMISSSRERRMNLVIRRSLG